jgi:uncharacterized protein
VCVLTKNSTSSENEKIFHCKVGGKVGEDELNIEHFGRAKLNFYKEHPNLIHLTKSPRDHFTKALLAHKPHSFGGTAYFFCKDVIKEQELDYLFVDEASQVALANLVAVSNVAKNIILMGDQMQLEQPIKASHPGESGESALEFMLGEHKVVPNDLGVFLGETWRMHPNVCKPISDIVYESQLQSEKTKVNQRVLWENEELELKPAGIQLVNVEHDSNTHSSIEEVKKIKEILRNIEQSQYQDSDKKVHDFNPDNVLIVAPYNAQVNLLKAELGACYSPFIGTIDKFQGKEAEIVIVSMTSSIPGESSRGIDFLFNLNRLNVAISRAKALAIVVASPELKNTRATNPKQIKKISSYLTFTE